MRCRHDPIQQEETIMAETNAVRPEDVSSVGTRISWGAVLAGAVVTLALYLVLTMLGSAIGLTAGGWARPETLSVAAMVWAVVAMCAALFAGGCVTSQLTAGETKPEAMVHGVILWGAVVAILLWLTATGVKAGFNAMMGAAYAGQTDRDVREGDLEEAARRLGVPQKTIDNWRESAREARETVRETAEDESARKEAQEKARKNLALVTWWSLFGTLLSMGAAIGGALLSAGPSRRVLPPMGVGVSRHGGVETRYANERQRELV
jgi:hypothetical protein